MMNEAYTKILQELRSLETFTELRTGGLFQQSTYYSYKPLDHFFKSLMTGSKGEAAAEELLKASVKDIAGIDLFTKVSVGRGVADYVLRHNDDIIPLELKSFVSFRYERTGEKSLVYKPLYHVQHKLEDYASQVKTYLQGADFVILTNLREVYFFSRTSVQGGFEAFKSLKFVDFLEFLCRSADNLPDALRRIEGASAKPNLDTIFFGSLQQWIHHFLSHVEFVDNAGDPTKKLSREEAVVMLMNKLIFIKTAEDYGMVDFRMLSKDYKEARHRWVGKNNLKLFENFFRNIEDFFEEYYNTDLFAERFWHYVKQTPENAKVFQRVFETVLGVDAWNEDFGNGLLHYNYQQIDEDIFGKAYETYIAEELKDDGIYYTPVRLARYMSRTTVSDLLEERTTSLLAALHKDHPDIERAEQLFAEFRSVRFIDPTSGSGSFLVKIFRDIYTYYERIAEVLEWTRLEPDVLFKMPESVQQLAHFRAKYFDNRYRLVSRIILDHVFAADMDKRALETAKTNLWKEILKLNPQAYNYNNEIFKKFNHVLPNLALNGICGDMLVDIPIATQLAILSTEHAHTLRRLHEIRMAYLDNPFEPDVLDEAVELLQTLHERLLQELPEPMRELLVSLGRKPVFVCAEFFFAWFQPDGNPLPESEQGFHAVVSNPPWEVLKPIAKEFAHIGKYSMTKQQFDTYFAKRRKTEPEFDAAWQLYQQKYDLYRQFLREYYQHQGEGDLNLFKLFMERNAQLLRPQMPLTLLVPSSIQTDKECADLRQQLLFTHTLRELLSFENRGYEEFNEVEQRITRVKFFPDVHPQYKFTIVRAVKAANSDAERAFWAKFYMTDPAELEQKQPIGYTVDMVRRFSPEHLSIMEFDSAQDYHLCSTIRAERMLLGEAGYQFRREFHMTDDASIFIPVHKNNLPEYAKKSLLPLYEGKMIHQFHPHFAPANFMVEEVTGKTRLCEVAAARMKKRLKLRTKIAEIIDQYFTTGIINLEYTLPRLVYRAVASSTNERTLIATLIPSHSFTVHSLNYLVNTPDDVHDTSVSRQYKHHISEMLILTALLNSLVLNYYIRNKVSANLTMNFMYELPLPSMNEAQRRRVAQMAHTLLVANSQGEFDGLVGELGFEPLVRRTSYLQDSTATVGIRAELEVLIARELYGLSAEDWQYLVSTFIYGNSDSPTKQELDAVIAETLLLYNT